MLTVGVLEDTSLTGDEDIFEWYDVSKTFSCPLKKEYSS